MKWVDRTALLLFRLRPAARGQAFVRYKQNSSNYPFCWRAHQQCRAISYTVGTRKLVDVLTMQCPVSQSRAKNHNITTVQITKLRFRDSNCKATILTIIWSTVDLYPQLLRLLRTYSSLSAFVFNYLMTNRLYEAGRRFLRVPLWTTQANRASWVITLLLIAHCLFSTW